jgi:hypothetical protein
LEAAMRMFLLLVGVASATPALAQSNEEERGLVITGKIQRPEVQVIIGRDNLDKGFELRLEESFLKRILEVLTKPPF